MKKTVNYANVYPIASYFTKRVETYAKEDTQDSSLASTENLIPSTSANSAAVTSLTTTISDDIDVEVSGFGTLIDGPSQPKLLSYPRDQKNRSFRTIWYTSFPWLEYSIARETLPHQHQEAIQHLLKLVYLPGQRRWKPIAVLSLMTQAQITCFP